MCSTENVVKKERPHPRIMRSAGGVGRQRGHYSDNVNDGGVAASGRVLTGFGSTKFSKKDKLYQE